MVELTPLPETAAADNPEGTAMVLREPSKEQALHLKMRPGETYVTVLPGHSRPAFVRRRRYHGESPFGLTALARAFGGLPGRRRSHSIERVMHVESAPSTTCINLPPPLPLEHPIMSRSPFPTQESIHTYPDPSRHLTRVSEQRSHPVSYTTRVITHDDCNEHISLQHTCCSCGRYRSPSYHSRHPLAPGELPRRSMCRRCIRQRTSSEESVEGLRTYHKVRSLRRPRQDFSQRTESYRYVIESSDTRSTSSASKEDIRIIRRTSSFSRDGRRLRSRSSSRCQPQVQVTIQPRLIPSRSKSYSANPKGLVERTEHVRRRDLSTSQTDSLGSDHWTDVSYEETLPVRPRSRGYGEAGRYTVTKSYLPREVRNVSYGYDGDYTGECDSYSTVGGRRSESVLTQHESPHKSRKHAPVAGHVQGGSSRDNAHRRHMEYESYAEANAHVPSNAFRVARVKPDEKIPNEHRGGERWTSGQRRIALETGSFRRQRSSNRHIIEEDDLSESQRQREKRELVIDRIDDRPLPIRSRHYSDSRRRPVLSVESLGKHVRYLTAGPDEDYETVHGREETHSSRPQSYVPPAAPMPREAGSTTSSYYPNGTDEGGAEGRRWYCYVPEGAVRYREI